MTLKELPPAPPMPNRQNGRRVKRGLLVAVIGFLSVLLVALIAAIVWVVRTDSRINRLPGDELTSLATTVSDTRTILIVGSDSRENIGDLEGKFGAFDGARTDVIMLARIEPDAGIHLLSIPRDLLVDIPGRDPNRINAAFAFGGPDLLIDTLQRALDVEINHYVEVDFAGFEIEDFEQLVEGHDLAVDQQQVRGGFVGAAQESK